MVAEIDALIVEVEKYRGSNTVEPVKQDIMATYVPAWNAVNSGLASASPGGANTNVQFNNSGAFGGSSFFKFNRTTGHLALGKNSSLLSGVILDIEDTVTADLNLIQPVAVQRIQAIFSDNGVTGFNVIYGIDLTLTVIEPNVSGDIAGLRIQLNNFGAGQINANSGIKIELPLEFAPHIQNNYGIYISDQSTVGAILSYNIFSDGAGKNHFHGGVEVATAAQIVTSTVALTNGAGVGAGTLGTAPAAGDPTKWIGINDNGVIRYVPAW